MFKKSANVRNSLWNVINILVFPIAFLAATPLFIYRLSESQFGVWMLVNSYVYIAVNIIGFGLPNSIIAYVAESIGLKNKQKLHAYINAASRLFGRMSFITIIAAMGAAVLLYLNWIPVEDDIWILIILATIWIALKFPEIMYQSIFKGFERYDQSTIYNVLPRMISLLFQIILVLLGFGLKEIFMANIVVTLLFIIVQAIIIYMKLPDYSLVIFKPLEERKALYHFGFWTWMQTIIGVISFQLDRFIVAFYLGTSAVAYYALAATIANHFHMAFEAVVSWLFPKIARIKEQSTNTKSYFHTIRTFSVGISLLGILVIFFLSQPIFLIWLGEDSYLKTIDLFQLFLIYEAFIIMSIVPKLYLNGIKSLKFVTALEFLVKFSLILGMIIAFIIAPTAESIIWGQIFSLITTMPIVYYLVNKKILHENTFQETFITILPSICVMFAIFVSNTLLSLAIIILAIIIFWFYYFKKKNFNWHLLLE